jgi:hypothetical protein
MLAQEGDFDSLELAAKGDLGEFAQVVVVLVK